MAMDWLLHLLAFTLVVTLTVSSSDPPEFSPSPAPELGSDDSPSIPTPSPSPYFGSPAAPPPLDLSPYSAPAPSLDVSSPPDSSPAPAPSEVSDISTNEKSEAAKESSSGGKKAGVAFGVIAAACVVGFGGMVYKKRQQNIRRAQFGYAARREFL